METRKQEPQTPRRFDAATTDNPSWWTDQHTSSWDRIKEAFRRDWEQTKANFGMGSGMNLRQDASDTLKQATGSTAVPPLSEETRPANSKDVKQARERMFEESKRAAEDIAKAQDRIGKEQAKLAERTREANQAFAKEREKLSQKLVKANQKASDRMDDAQDDIDDAVLRSEQAQEEWAQAEQEARYGFAARSQYPQFSEWNMDLETTLRGEWVDMNPDRSWEAARLGVRRGWEFSEPQRH